MNNKDKNKQLAERFVKRLMKVLFIYLISGIFGFGLYFFSFSLNVLVWYSMFAGMIGSSFMTICLLALLFKGKEKKK